MAKKRRYFKKKAVLKAISRYHRTKINFVTDVMYTNENNTFIDGQQTNSLVIGEILVQNTGEFQRLGKQFGFVKLRGVYIEAIPIVRGSRFNTGLCLGQANDSIVFNSIRTQPNVMLISWNQRTRMYVKINSEYTSTNSIELFNNVAILPFSQGEGTSRYCLKVTLYLTFKTNL